MVSMIATVIYGCLLIVLGPVAHPHVQDGPQQNSLNQKATTGVKQWPLFMTPVLFFLFLHLSPTSSNVFFLYFCLYCSLLVTTCLLFDRTTSWRLLQMLQTIVSFAGCFPAVGDLPLCKMEEHVAIPWGN